MAQLIDVIRVEVGPRALVATVRLSEDAPLMTSEDLEGTTRVYRLMPGIIDHLCLGDAGDTFRDVMGNTELAHLLEHATVELLAQSELAGDISSGRTRAAGDDGRTFEIELACPDDVLVCGALSSACWMLDWAFSGGEGPEPDVEATVRGLVGLVQSLPAPEAQEVAVHDDPSPRTGSLLQLVSDEDVAPRESAARRGRRESEVTTSAGAAVAVADAPLRHSPEALQSAADVPAEEAAQTGRTPRSASPSITADLPASTPLR